MADRTTRLDANILDDTDAEINPATEAKQGDIITNLQGLVCTNNSTDTPLLAGETFTGTAGDIRDFGVMTVGVYADVPGAVDGIKFDFSPNGTDWYNTDLYTYLDDGITKVYTLTPVFRYYRIRYTNGGTNQTTFHLQTVLKRGFKASSHRIQDDIVDEDDAELVKAILTAKKPNGVFTNIDSTAGGNLKVSIEEQDPGAGLATEETLQKLVGFEIPAYDYIDLTYVASGNGVGEIETVVYKTGGSGGTTVATLTLAYDANNNISSVTKT